MSWSWKLAAKRSSRQTAAAYAKGLSHWRAREFDAAVTCFSGVADFDKPSALFLKRSQEFAKAPPDAGWEPVSALEGK